MMETLVVKVLMLIMTVTNSEKKTVIVATG